MTYAKVSLTYTSKKENVVQSNGWLSFNNTQRRCKQIKSNLIKLNKDFLTLFLQVIKNNYKNWTANKTEINPMTLNFRFH